MKRKGRTKEGGVGGGVGREEEKGGREEKRRKLKAKRNRWVILQEGSKSFSH
jgi:hypothetical protein